jgi:catechol 2,3-dioxygenase-like lactoylglutathione lyase family enzyme
MADTAGSIATVDGRVGTERQGRERCGLGHSLKGKHSSKMVKDVEMRVDHVSIAVRSIERAVEFFSRYFPMKERNPKMRDDQVSGAFFWQDFWLGGFVVEFIEDLPGERGFVSKFIEKHGEGMHHLSIEVNHLEPIIENLKRDGYGLSMSSNIHRDRLRLSSLLVQPSAH